MHSCLVHNYTEILNVVMGLVDAPSCAEFLSLQSHRRAGV